MADAVHHKNRLLTLYAIKSTTPAGWADKLEAEQADLKLRILRLLDQPDVLTSDSANKLSHEICSPQKEVDASSINYDYTPNGQSGSFGRLQEIRKWLSVLRQTMETRVDEWIGTEDSLFYRKIIHRLAEWLVNSESITYRSMICQCLQNVLASVLFRTDYQTWCDQDKQALLIDFIDFPLKPDWFIRTIRDKFCQSYRRPVPTSVRNLDEWYSSVVNLAQCAKAMWPVEGGLCVLREMQRDVLERTSSKSMAYIALLEILGGPEFCYLWALRDPRCGDYKDLFEIWQLSSPCLSPWWDNIFLRMLSSAVKYAWATNSDEMIKLQSRYISRVCLVLNRSGLRVPVTMSRQSVPPDAETDRQSADLNFLTKASCSGSGTKSSRASMITKASADILVYLLTPRCDTRYGSKIWDIISSIFTVLEPYARSTSAIPAKTDLAIGTFMAQFLRSYLKRVGRERSWLWRKTDSGPSLRLGPVEDRFVSACCMHLCREGISKTSHDVVQKYDVSLSYLCTLDPTGTVQWLTQKLALADRHTEPLLLMSILRLMARFSRFIAIYSPETILQLLSMVDLAMDVSEQIRAMSLLSCFLSLSTFIPLTNTCDRNVDKGPQDVYVGDLDIEKEWERLLPMFGAKTIKNKALFEKSTFTNIRNYPNERLADDDVAGAKAISFVDPYQTNMSYQNVEELRAMFETRCIVHRCVCEFAEALVGRMLDALGRMGTGKEDALDESLANTMQSLVYSLVSDMSSDLVERVNTHFWKWCAEMPRGSILKLMCAMAGGLGSSSRYDSIKASLPIVNKVLYGNSRLSSQDLLKTNIKASEDMIKWIIEIFTSSMTICDRKWLKANLESVVTLAWSLMHQTEVKVFKCGTSLLSGVIEKLLESDVAGWRASSAYSTPEQIISRWTQPACTLGEQTRVAWDLPTDDDIDDAIELSTLYLSFLRKLRLTDGYEMIAFDEDFHAETFRRHKKNEGRLRDFTSALVATNVEHNVKDADKNKEVTVFRYLRSMKKLNQSLSAMFVDEPESRTLHGFIAESRSLGSELITCSVAFVRWFGDKWLGLQVDQQLRGSIADIEDNQPQSGANVIDKVKVCQKLLRLCDYTLMRVPPSLRGGDPLKNIEGWASFGVWSNPLFQLHKYAALEFAGASAYIERVQQSWLYRLECPSERLRLTPERKWLIAVVLCMTTCAFSQARVLAQKLLTDIIKAHIRSRDIVLERLIDEWEIVSHDEQWFGAQIADGNTDEPLELLPDVTPRDTLSDEGGDSATDRRAADDVSEAEAEDYHKIVRGLSQRVGRVSTTTKEDKADRSRDLHRYMTGLIFVLGDAAMMRRLMSHPSWRERLTMNLIDALSRPVDQPSLGRRLLALARTSIDSRSDTTTRHEDIPANKRMITPDDNREFVSKLLDKLEKEPNMHWRSQTYAVGLIVTQITERNVAGRKDLVGRIARCLIACLKSVASLSTLSACGLTILVKMIVKASAEPKAAQLADEATVKHICESVSLILEQLTTVHVQITKNRNGNDLLYHLLIDVFRCDRSWPPSIVGKYSTGATGLSLHCCALSQTMIKALYTFLGDEKCLEYIENKILKTIIKRWVDQDKASPSDEECYCATAEFYAGMFRASRKWKLETMNRLFELSVPNLLERILSGQNAESNIWLDSARYCIQGIVGGTKMKPRSMSEDLIDHNFKAHWSEYVKSVINAYVNCKACSTEYLDVVGPPSKTGGNADMESSSLEYRRRILTASTLHYDLQSLDPDEVDWCRRTFFDPVAMQHDYKRVRDTIAHGAAQFTLCCSGMCLMFERLQLSNHLSVGKCHEALEYLHEEIISARYTLMKGALEKFKEEQIKELAPPTGGVLEFLTVANIIKMVFTHPARKGLWPLAVSICPLLLEARSFNPDSDVGQCGKQATDILFNNATFSEVPQRGDIEKILLDSHWSSPAFRKQVLQILELYIAKQAIARIAIGDFRDLEEKVQDYVIDGLTDPTYAEFARPTYAVLCAVFDQDMRASTAKSILDSLPAPQDAQQDPKSAGKLMAVATLIASCGTSYIPPWVPTTLTKFARYANQRAPDQCRRIVEQALQTFFHTYHHDWENEHKAKFTANQLDVLQQFRGRPVYFS